MGENPTVGSMNGALQRRALRKLDWLVVRDFRPTETAEFWRDAPEIARGEVRTEDIDTEVFFFPCAAHTEKDGHLHQHPAPAAVARAGDRPAGRLPQRAALHARAGAADEGALRRTRPSSRTGRSRHSSGTTRRTGPHDEPVAEAVLAEINGYRMADRAPVAGVRRARRRRLDRLRLLDLLRVLRRRGQPGGPPPAGRRAELGGPGVGLGLARQPAHPLQPRLGRPRGPPWSERKAYVWWDEEAGAWTGHDVPDFLAGRPPSYRPAAGRDRRRRDLRHRPVHHAGRRQGLAVRADRHPRRAAADALRAARVGDREPALRAAVQPGPDGVGARRQPVPPGLRRPALPVRDHHLPAHRAPHRRRDEPLAVVAERAAAGDVLRGLARAGARARAGPRRLGHDHDRPRRDRGARAGDRAHRAAAGAAPAGAHDRAALPLGRARGWCGATRPTS